MEGIYEYIPETDSYRFEHSPFQDRKVRRCASKIEKEPFYNELLTQIMVLDKENRRLMEINSQLNDDINEINDIIEQNNLQLNV